MYILLTKSVALWNGHSAEILIAPTGSIYKEINFDSYILNTNFVLVKNKIYSLPPGFTSYIPFTSLKKAELYKVLL